MAQQEMPFSHVMCVVGLAMDVIRLYGDVPMCRLTRTRKIIRNTFFFDGSANVAQKCEITDRITDRKVFGFGFGNFLQITE